LREYPTVARYQFGVLQAQVGLAEILWDTGRSAEAQEVYRQVRALGDRLKPEDWRARNQLAWFLATCPDPQHRDAPRAVELAKAVVRGQPEHGYYWVTLGAAQYGMGDYQAAVRALEQAHQLPSGRGSSTWFFLAMAHWQLGDKDQALKLYD